MEKQKIFAGGMKSCRRRIKEERCTQGDVSILLAIGNKERLLFIVWVARCW